MLGSFDRCVDQYGQKVAVDFQGQTLTYQALQLRINQVANYLEGYGVGGHSSVGLCLERGIDALVSLLAILRIGATYIPLDPTYPKDRLDFMLAETQPTVVLTQSPILPHLPLTTAKTICLDTEREAIEQCPTSFSATAATDSLAYIMYTSGSTGKPKGVKMPRSSVMAYLQAIGEVLAIQPEDVYLHVASFSFSSSVRQLLVPLSCGATVVFASQDQAKNPMVLLELMQEKGITVSDTVASVWRSVLQAVKSLEAPKREALLNNALRLILLSGDITACSVLQQVRQSLTSRPDIINIYGQTETIGVCAYRLPADFDRTDGYVPVGFPYDHNRIYILDEDMRPVPQGEIGELYVSGACLAEGYMNRPDLTEQQFLVNPWAEAVPGQPDQFSRLYKTGDLARQLPDGCMEMQGRADFQVKLRGMRVELGEIERTIEACPLAKEAIVLAKEDAQGDKRLVAYVVPQPAQAQLSDREFASQLKATLERSLTDYLMPSLVMRLEALPLTPNGKRDRLALPEPDWSSLSSGSTEVQAATEVEAALLKIWSELFGFTPGLEDSFFALGGHSLLAVQLFVQIDSAFGCKLSFVHLLECPTIQTLAAYIQTTVTSGEVQEKSTILVPLRPEGSKPPLFCIHGVGGAALYYDALLPYLPEDQPVYGIQSQGFDGIEAPLHHVEEMAKLYLKEIRQVYPEGPLYLLGHSFGGLVAYEIACILEKQGEAVALLALADAKTPKLAKTPPSAGRLLKTITRNLWNMPHAQRTEYLLNSIQWFYKKRKVLDDREYAEQLKRKNPHIPMLNVLEPNYRAAEIYNPQPYSGDMVVFRALTQSPRSAHTRSLGWNELVKGQIRVHTIPGMHTSIMEEPNVKVLVKALKLYLGVPAKVIEIVFPDEAKDRVA